MFWTFPDRKVHVANMGPIWGWQDPGGSHFGPMNYQNTRYQSAPVGAVILDVLVDIITNTFRILDSLLSVSLRTIQETVKQIVH